MGDTVHIRVLGTSFTIQTDKRPEYVESLISYIENKVSIIEASAGSKDHLKTAILASVLITDELFQSRENSGAVPAPTGMDARGTRDAEEIERYARELIRRIDETLESGNNEAIEDKPR